jgi:haloalkane dehalogenase
MNARAAPGPHWERAAQAQSELGLLFPFPQHFHDHGGVFQHFLDEGLPSAPPCLLLHGNPTWSFAWRRLVGPLSKHHRVVAPDHIGCGLSDKPYRYPYTLERHIENVERLALALELERITLILHDWGGAIGMGFARRHPERVSRLVFLNTAAFVGGDMPRRIAACRVPGFGQAFVCGLNGFARAATRMAVAKPLPPEVKQGYLFPYRRLSDRVGLLRFVQDIPRRPGDRSYAELEAIDVALDSFRDRPACLIWGERDWCFTPAFRRIFEVRLPKAESHPLKDAGHYVFEDEPEEVLKIIQAFLAAHPLP